MFSAIKLNQFPAELLFEMFSHTRPETVSSARAVCKTFAILFVNHQFWIDKIKLHFPAVDTKNILDGFSEFRKLDDAQYYGLSVQVKKLFSCVKENDVEGLKQLKQAEFSIRMLDYNERNGETILECARMFCGPQSLKELLCMVRREFQTNENTVDTQKKDKLGRTIFWYALHLGTDEEISELLSKGSQLSEQYAQNGFRPIHTAVKTGRLNIVKLFIEKDPALLEQADSCAQTPLLWAASEGHGEIVEYLLQKGANPEVSTNRPGHIHHGKTSLHWACEHGHYPVVKILINAGADLASSKAAAEGLKPLHLAARGGKLDIVKLIIEKNSALLEQADSCAQTPLLWAASEGHGEIVKYLLQKGANPEVSTNSPGHVHHGKTPLHWACEHGHYPVVKILIDAGANLSSPALSGLGENFIHLVAMSRQLDIVKLGIETDPASLEKPNTCGQTPLLFAAELGLKEVVELLLEKGANLHALTNTPGKFGHGFTVFDWVLHWGCYHRHYRVLNVVLNFCLKHYLFFTLIEKSIDTSKLPETTQAKIQLFNYIANIAANKTKNNAPLSFKLFNGSTYQVGYSDDQKLDAAYAIVTVLNGEDPAILQSHLGAIQNSKRLKAIARDLGLNLQTLTYTKLI